MDGRLDQIPGDLPVQIFARRLSPDTFSHSFFPDSFPLVSLHIPDDLKFPFKPGQVCPDMILPQQKGRSQRSCHYQHGCQYCRYWCD